MKTDAKTVKLIRYDDQLNSKFSEKEILSLQSLRTIKGGDGTEGGGGSLPNPLPPPPPGGGGH